MVDKIDPSIAAGLYKNMQGIGAGQKADAPDERGFGAVMKQLASDSLETLHAGEKASALAVAGKAELSDVVEAVTNADLTLQTIVAMRDRLMGAYQEIMRMPI